MKKLEYRCNKCIQLKGDYINYMNYDNLKDI